MVNRSFNLLLRRTGLPNIRFHDLWHTSATLMLEMGLNPKLAQKRLGHSNVSVTMGIYSHVISEMCLEAAKVIEDLLGYRSLVHIQDRFRAMSYGNEHETSYLRTYAF